MACTGQQRPWLCKVALPQLRLGNNIIELSLQNTTGESARSNPMLVFYAFQGIDVSDIPKSPTCKPGSYIVDRITDASKLAGIVNSRNFVSNILATTNAIYVFSCEKVE